MLRFEMRLRKGKRNAARDHLFSGSEAVNRGTPSIVLGSERGGDGGHFVVLLERAAAAAAARD